MIPISPNPDCDDTVDWLWPAAERAQVPVVLGAAMFLPTVGKIAERHPGLKLIVDHMGVPRASKGSPTFSKLRRPRSSSVNARPLALL
jgi:hypothetical protein